MLTEDWGKICYHCARQELLISYACVLLRSYIHGELNKLERYQNCFSFANVPVIVILPECSIVVINTKWYFNIRGTEWKRVNTVAILFYSSDTRTPLQIALTSELLATPQFGMNTKLRLVFESSPETFVASNKRRNWRSEITMIYGSYNDDNNCNTSDNRNKNNNDSNDDGNKDDRRKRNKETRCLS